ncbi:MAG TPA: TIGR03435 family protein, partial [Candidatus Acidoferrales bacterium]|nr:TIGR03435 family protein [Candidatus Acidoferrales bacterium]
SAAPGPSFEVVSIKPAGYHRGYDIHMRGDLYSAVGVTAEFLIKYAYGITDDQLSGGPDWINSDKYAIDAKIPDSTAAEWHKKYDAKKQAEEMQSMMRSLLEDRFQLKIGHQTKELPVFALVIAKGGPKISPSKDDGSKSGSDGHNEGYVEINHVTDEPISVLIDILSRQSETAGRKIIDETGLTGKYTYALKWTRERPPSDSDPADLPVSSAPLLWDALQDQLGLQLKSTKAPVDTIVIEHIEKPTSN